MEDPIERKSKVVKTEALEIDLEENSNETDEIQPILNPLLYYTVLKNLFKYFLVHELKVARSVCSEWYKISSPFLSKESRVGIACGQRHSHVSRFLQFNKSFGFLSIRERCRNKKLYTNFSIRNLRLATLSELQIFKIYGHYMRELSLFSIYFRNYDNILKLIYHELPHLVKLKMVSTRGTWDDAVDRYFDSLPPIEEESFSIRLTSLDISNYDKAEISPELYTVNLCNFFRKCTNLTEISFRGLYPFLTHCLNKVYDANPQNVSNLTIQLLTFENPPSTTSFLQAGRKIISTFPLRKLSMELKLPPQEWKLLFQSSNFSNLKELFLVFKPIPVSQTDEFDDDYFTSVFLPPKNENGNSTTNCDYPHPKFQNLQRLAVMFHPNHFDRNFHILHNGKTIFPNVTSLSWKYQSPILSYPCTTSTWHSSLPSIFQELSILFPNTKCLEATIGSTANFRNLVTSFRNIEELRITQESYSLADLDLLGPTRFFGANNSLIDRNAGEGIFSITGLTRLYLNNDCLRLTNKSIDRGFLQMPQLSVLKLYSHTLNPRKPPSFSKDCLQALQRKNFVSLDIDISKSGPRGTRTIFQC